MQPPLIVFGAFDRHNFGDMLFAHVAAAMRPHRECLFAGLAARDLEAFGGHRVQALHRLRVGGRGPAPDLLHAGGEILTCTAWQAAVMLQDAADAQGLIAYLEHRPLERDAWVRSVLGSAQRMPYVASPRTHPGLRWTGHDAVGGVGLERLAEEDRAEVLSQLRLAGAVGVRDHQTRARLRSAGLPDAVLMPDPVSMLRRLFGTKIARRQEALAPASVRQTFDGRYLAAQFSADFSDDATLKAIAEQLTRAARQARLGVALFRSGAAPWHDDAAALQKIADWMPAGSAMVFPSLDVWDICALVAGARCYAGSSLHGRIVAMAFGVPRINVVPRGGGGTPGKCEAYAQTWEVGGMPHVCEVPGMAEGIAAAMASDASRLDAWSDHLAAAFDACVAARRA